MAAYIQSSVLLARMPTDFLTKSTTDGGTEDAATVLSAVIASAQYEVDALLISSGAPFSTPIPPLVTHATELIALEILCQRRNMGKDNPFSAGADEARGMLKAVASGQMQLTAGAGVDPSFVEDGDDDYEAMVMSHSQQDGL